MRYMAIVVWNLVELTIFWLFSAVHVLLASFRFSFFLFFFFLLNIKKLMAIIIAQGVIYSVVCREVNFLYPAIHLKRLDVKLGPKASCGNSRRLV